MPITNTLQTNTVHAHECTCFTWKPVVAGALIAIGLSFLLNLFSAAIGLTAFTTNSQGVENLAFSGLIATVLGIVVAMFASGWVAGYLGNRYCTKRHLGALYGFLAWCLALIVSVFIADEIAKYLTYYTHFISGVPANAINNAVNASSTNTGLPLPGGESKETKIVVSTYILFCLFFLSAFAASLGGHCGMRYVCKEECLSR